MLVHETSYNDQDKEHPSYGQNYATDSKLQDCGAV